MMNTDIQSWLEAYARGYSPDGRHMYDHFHVVREGDVVEGIPVRLECRGYGDPDEAVILGNAEIVAEGETSHDGGGAVTHYGTLRFVAPSVVRGSRTGRTNDWFVWVCATKDQIEEAKAAVAERRAAEAEAADPALPNLRQELRWGMPWSHKGKDVAGRVRMLLSGEECGDREAMIAETLTPAAAAELRCALRLPDPLAVYREVEAEVEREAKAERQTFAREKLEELKRMGFSEGKAARIMRAAGPGRVVRAVEWAKLAFATVPSADALDSLLSGLGGRHAFGWARAADALRAFGLETPESRSSRDFFAVLAGAHEAILAGIPQ